MRNRAKVAGGALAIVLIAGTVQAQSPWVHVRVNEGNSDENVSVNLPLSLVEVVLKSAPEHVVNEGRFQIGRHETQLTVADLRRMWAELSEAGDANLVTIEDDGKTVRVGRRGEQIQVRIAGKDDGEQVAVDVPARVVDALLSGSGEELNLEAAIEELRAIRGDVVNFRGGDDDDSVRVWIDETAS